MEVKQWNPTLRADGRYVVQVRLHAGPKGRIAIYGTTPEDAVEKAKKRVEAHNQTSRPSQRSSRDLPSYPEGTFADFAYRVWFPHVYPNLRETSKRKYDTLLVLHLLPALAYQRMADVGYAEAQRMADGLTRKDKRGDGSLPARQKREVILRFKEIMGLYKRLEQARSNRHVRDDWDMLKPPRVPAKKKREVPEQDFSLKLLEACLPHERGPVFAALFLGLRRGEICGLRKNKIDRRQLTISVDEQHQPEYGSNLVATKGEARTIYIPKNLISKLDALSNPDSVYVFTDKKQRPWKPNELSKVVQRVCDRANLPATTLHDLRSHAASNLAALGVPLPEIMAILGHKNVSTSMIYVNSAHENQRKALGRLFDSLGSESNSRQADLTTA